MTLYYSLVREDMRPQQPSNLANKAALGLHAPRLRDDSLHESDHPYALQVEEEALHLPLREPYRSEGAILAEGKTFTNNDC